MKQRLKNFWNDVKVEMRENKSTFLVYSGLRILVFGMMILQIFNQNYQNVFLCILTLVLMIMPSVVQATFKVEFPSALEIVVLVFIFAAEILGEISAFYMKFPYWDTVLHTLNGFLCAALGFSLVDIMNTQRKLKFELSPLFMAITAFCFSMTIGVMWELFEFAMDTIFKLDMQKDTVVNAISTVLLDPTQSNECVYIADIYDVAVNGNSLGLGGYLDIGLMDTMYDLTVNFIGAVVFSVMGYFYVKHKDEKSLIDGFVPTKWSEEKKSKQKIRHMKEKNKKIKGEH
ncbi:MAG: hypothetical protein IJX66_09980 [Lachnospiraceae bacterium]|nr:hypothetical protein [Lachnospiraceae bacterium]